MRISKLLQQLNEALDEDLELKDSSSYNDEGDFLLGDYYNAYTEEDLINSLDEMIVGDSTGCILRSKFNHDLFAELMINFLDENLYDASFERDGQNEIERTRELSKAEMLKYIKNILYRWQVSSFEARQEYDNENK